MRYRNFSGERSKRRIRELVYGLEKLEAQKKAETSSTQFPLYNYESRKQNIHEAIVEVIKNRVNQGYYD